nr:EOG090X0OQM [Ilyocryptus agilis]
MADDEWGTLESWEDEENGEKSTTETKQATAPSKKKSSKRLVEKIEAKERKMREEAELRRLQNEANMTPEERMAEKLKRQKLVEDADFEVAKDTFVEVEVLKKVSLTAKSLHEEKLKMVKAASKTGKKGKGKAVIKMDKETDNYGDDYGGGEYDDFM